MTRFFSLNFCDSIFPQFYNEDDSSEGAASAEPSTSSQAAGALAGISNPAAVDTEAPPPPYNSVVLGATAAPGTDTWKSYYFPSLKLLKHTVLYLFV